MKAKCGRVLGCPLFTLGSEVSTQEDRLQKKVQEILDQKLKYLESAIRDAHAAGLIHAPDASSKAKMLFAYYQGLYTQARIQNDLKVLTDSLRGTFDLLGLREAQPVAA
jgi:TetR/AcrR family transcriptional repressor of nem operon